MSFARTLVLVLVAMALGAWLWFVESPKAVLESKADILADFEPAHITKVRMAYPEGSEIVVERVPEGQSEVWKMTTPVQAPADASSIENFLNTIREVKIERRLTKEEAGSLASYGLEGERGSQARLELTKKDGTTLPPLVIGIATPVGYQAFVRREGSDEVLVIPLLLQSSVKKTPFELRMKTLLPGVDSSGVKQVTIRKPARPALPGEGGDPGVPAMEAELVELERKDEATWLLSSPVTDRADAESVRSMLDSIATIDALAFFDGAEARREDFGLGADAVHFVAKREDGSTIEFKLGKEAADQPAGFYFERSSDGQVAKVPDWSIRKFAPPANELREKRLLSCKADEIRSMTWSSPGFESFTISREAADRPWTISPVIEGETLNQGVVNNAVNAIVLARADEVVGDARDDASLKEWGLDEPVARFEVQAASGPCAAIIAAPNTGPERSQGGKEFFLKDATRSAVLMANQHEFSRVSMRRSEFVDAAAKAAAPAPEAAPGH